MVSPCNRMEIETIRKVQNKVDETKQFEGLEEENSYHLISIDNVSIKEVPNCMFTLIFFFFSYLFIPKVSRTCRKSSLNMA